MPQLTFISVLMWAAQDGGALLLGGAGIVAIIGILAVAGMARVFVTVRGIAATTIFGAIGTRGIGRAGVTRAYLLPFTSNFSVMIAGGAAGGDSASRCWRFGASAIMF